MSLIETLQGVVSDWFYHLAPQTITILDVLKTQLEAHFKLEEDVYALLAQLNSNTKEPHDPMSDFTEKFNK